MLCGMAVALSASAHVVSGPPNFKGKNICLTIIKPEVAGIDYDASPNPIVRIETTLGQQKATYIITVFGAGTLTLSEELALDTKLCAELPVNRFAWNDHDGERDASADFCLIAPNKQYRIHVQALAQAIGSARASLKRTVAGIAACRMKWPSSYSLSYDLDDRYRPDDPLLMGSYVVPDYTPQ